MKTITALLLIAASFSGSAQSLTKVSEPGQTIDQFVFSIRKDVATFSRRNLDKEVCGMIQQKNDLFIVDLVVGDRSGCSMPRVDNFSGHTLHTHPYEAIPGFTTVDVESGPGYMIWRNEVHHQSGKGTERRVRQK